MSGRNGSPPADPDLVARVRQIERELLARAPEQVIEPSLDRIAELMTLLGDPQRSYPVIQLTGTNGKTTTSRMIDALLTEFGLTTGRYTSPHLSDIRERIAIGAEPISLEGFVRAYEDVEALARLVDDRSVAAGGIRLTFFELLTAMGYAGFADAPVDVAVVEVGLGGTWDATSVASAQVAVVLPVGLDHQEYLGPDLAAIATEKAGIIAAGSTAILGRQEPEVADIVAERCELVGARLLAYGRDFGVSERQQAVGGQQVSLYTPGGEYADLALGLHGAHQGENAAAAVAAVEAFLAPAGERLDPATVRAGLAAATSPGRLEVVRRSPTILVDAAHNPHGAAALAEAIRESFVFTTLVGLVSVLREKDAAGILEALEPVLDQIVVTRNSSPRAMSVQRLAEIAEGLFGEHRVRVETSLPDAVDTAVSLAEADGLGGAVLATGSVVTAGEVRRLLLGDR